MRKNSGRQEREGTGHCAAPANSGYMTDVVDERERVDKARILKHCVC